MKDKLSRRDFTAGLLATGALSNAVVEAADGYLNDTVASADPSDKIVVYQIFTRLFGNQKTTNKPWGSRDENGVGKFNDITDKALRELKAFGVSHVWYTGAIEHATMTDYSAEGIQKDNPLVVKGRAGSPYAIKDYYDVDPDLAVNVKNRMQEFESLLKRSHANGVKVIVEFWGWAIPQVKAGRPGLVFIAEIYNPKQYKNYIQVGKFDYLYDKVGLYDALRRLMEGKGSVEDITKVWQTESGDISEHMLRFLENHDEQRIASKAFAGDPWVAVPAMTLAATLHTGPVMVYFGQELGVNPTQAEGFQGNDGRTTIFDYWGIPEYQAWTNSGKFDGRKLNANQKKLRQFYGQLNKLISTSDAIRTGAFYDLQADNRQSDGYDQQRLYSYLRYSDKQKLLIVCNFDKQKTAKTTVRIPTEAWQAMKLDAAKAHTFRDIFRTKTSFTARSNVPITLPPLGVLVLEIV